MRSSLAIARHLKDELMHYGTAECDVSPSVQSADRDFENLLTAFVDAWNRTMLTAQPPILPPIA